MNKKNEILRIVYDQESIYCISRIHNIFGIPDNRLKFDVKLIMLNAT